MRATDAVIRVSCSTALLLGAGGATAGPPATVKNLGLAMGGFQSEVAIGAGRLAFLVDEARQGADLNGDADQNDHVLHLHDLQTGVTTNLFAAACAGIQFAGDRVVFLVDEQGQRGDFNGDGDTQDRVLFLHDTATGTFTNLALASFSAFFPATFSYPHVEGDRMLFQVDEAGEQLDLNGDGDAFDAVLHDYRFTTGAVTNLLIAGFPLPDGDRLLNLIPESATDMNGDGDAFDDILVLHDLTGGPTVVLPFAIDGSFLGPNHAIDAGVIGFHVGEFGQGAGDLNGDGDTNDASFHVHDAVAGTTVNLGLASDPLHPPRISHRRVAFTVDEAGHGGADLNGDGDAADHVLFVRDVTGGVTINLGLATGLLSPVSNGRTAFNVPELQQGADLNGDGDTQDDVAHLLDLATGTVTNLGFETFTGDVSLAGDLAVAAGSTIHAYDAATGVTRNVGVPGTLRHVGSGRVTFLRDEAAAGDSNGDGDANDLVVHAFDFATGTTINLGLADLDSTSEGDLLAVLVREQDQGSTDLNGDGDTVDWVLHSVQIDPASCGALTPYGLGCPGASAGTPELLLYGCPEPGSAVTVAVADAAPGATAFLFLGATTAALPMTPGCTLNVAPLFPFGVGPLPIGPAGGVSFIASIPPGIASGSVTIQGFIDAGIPAGFANTNGVRLDVP